MASHRALLKSIDQETIPDLVRQRLAALTWLLAQGLLDIKLAVPQSLRGIYHEKLGIFADAGGHLVTNRMKWSAMDARIRWCGAAPMSLPGQR